MIVTCRKKSGKCRCDLTTTLDKFLYGLNHLYFVYIPEEDINDKKERYLAIRRPGRTIGEIEVNENNIIVNARIAEEGVSSFTEDMNKALQQYVGQKIDKEKVCYHE